MLWEHKKKPRLEGIKREVSSTDKKIQKLPQSQSSVQIPQFPNTQSIRTPQ